MAVGSLTVIMAVLWLWLRGWIAESIDFTTAAGETVGSSRVPVGTQEDPLILAPRQVRQKQEHLEMAEQRCLLRVERQGKEHRTRC